MTEYSKPQWSPSNNRDIEAKQVISFNNQGAVFPLLKKYHPIAPRRKEDQILFNSGILRTYSP